MSKCSSVALICFLMLALVQAAPDGRILGGSPAKKGQFPYQISLKRKGKHICGGAIISKNYILTPAHCVLDAYANFAIFPVSMLEVHAGSIHIKKGGVTIPVAQIIKHPDYFKNKTHYNYDDLALLRLDKPLTFSETIQPIPLCNGHTLGGTPVAVSGWGHLRHNGTHPTELQWIIVESTSEKDCYRAKKLICLAHPQNEGASHGDSGGPAVAYGRLVSITSIINAIALPIVKKILLKLLVILIG